MKIVKYLVVILILLLFGCGDIMDDLVINNELIDNHIRFTLTSKKTFFIRDYYIMEIKNATNIFIIGADYSLIGITKTTTNFIELYTNSFKDETIDFIIKEPLEYYKFYEFYISLNPPIYLPRIYVKLLPELTNIILTNGEVVEKTNTQLKWSFKLEDLTN